MASEIEGLAVVAENKRSAIWLPWYAFPIVATTYWFAFKYDYLGVFIVAYMIAMYVFREQKFGLLFLALGMLFSYLIGVLMVDMMAVLPPWLLLMITFLWGVVVFLGLFNFHRDSNRLHLYLLSIERDNFIADLQQRNFNMAALSLQETNVFDSVWMSNRPVTLIRAARTSMHKYFVIAREMYQTCPTDLRKGCDISVMRMFIEVDAAIAVQCDAERYREYRKRQQETGNEPE